MILIAGPSSSGKTDAYKEYEQKTKGMTKEEKNMNGKALMTVFVEFGQMLDLSPESDIVQAQVKKSILFTPNILIPRA